MASLLQDIYKFLDDAPEAPVLRGRTYGLYEGNNITLHPTPGLWGQSPAATDYWTIAPNITNTAPPAASAVLLRHIRDIVSSANRQIDIAYLWQTNADQRLPGGYFLSALIAGFKALALRGARPIVRILVGMPIGPIVDTTFLCSWLKSAVGDTGLTVFIASQHSAPLSWNHAKIVAVDGRVALVGGENMWSVPYMEFAPIHDMSMTVEGSGVPMIHAFMDLLWSKGIIDSVKFEGGKCYPGVKPLGASQFSGVPVGAARTLGVGRLGSGIATGFTKTTDASVSARICAILWSKRLIRISQQGLGFTPTFVNPFDPGTMAALARAIHRGVQVQIVISGDGATDNAGVDYCPIKNSVTMYKLCVYVERELRNPGSDNPADYIHRSVPLFDVPVSKAAVDLVNRYVHMAALRFSDDPDPAWRANWQGRYSRVVPANHAKVYCVDDEIFYVGSDNMYMSGTLEGLQEFGYLVEGAGEVGKFLFQYWNPLWQYSSVPAARIWAKQQGIGVAEAGAEEPVIEE